MTESISENLCDDFRQALVACQRLYHDSAEYCLRYHPRSVRRSKLEFIELMDDLHRGVVVKTYLAMSLVDHRWQVEERRLARVLIEHAWNQQLEGPELRRAAEHLSNEVDKMSWYSLVRPFAEIEPLRHRVAELEGVIIRLATIVAAADGNISPAEDQCLVSIRHELAQHLRPLPLDDEPSTETKRSQIEKTVRAMESESVPLPGRTPVQTVEPTVSPGETDEQSLAQYLDELDGLIGLSAVKHEVRTLANLLKLHQHRARSGLPQTPVSLHMIFQGNPGTGKTTVARLVAKILQAMGILRQGHLVETDRSGLVAQYAGQTGPKTNQRIDEALDGVLFIDEAYSLVAATGDDPYGHEALQTLLKRMEDQRDRFVVILAGYPEPMQRLLSSNPGLSSRFNRSLTFEDYSPFELCQIFGLFCRKNQFTLDVTTRVNLMAGFRWLFNHRNSEFGNGRLVRNLFENAIRGLANRIASSHEVTHQLLTQFQPTDIAWPGGVDDSIFCDNREDQTVLVPCPGCQVDRTMLAAMLGKRVQCNLCQRRFVAEWGSLIDESDRPRPQ